MAFARIIERMDNKMIQQMKVKKQMKAMVQDAFMFGTSVGKLGFGAQFTAVPIPGGTGAPVGRGGERFEYSSLIFDNMPWFRRVRTGDFVVPWGTSDIDDTRWEAEWIKRDVDDVKSDPRFRNTGSLSSGNRTSLDVTGLSRHNHELNRPDMVELLEIRDKKFKKVIVFAPFSVEKPLLFEDDTLQDQGQTPNFALKFNPDDEVFWGVPDSIILEPHQLEINEIRTLQMKHRRMSLVKLLAQKNSISESEAAKLVSQDVTPVIWTEDSPESAVKVLTVSDIPAGLIQAQEIVQQDVRDTMGFSRNQSGEFSGAKSHAGPTATEAAIVQQASEIRVDERRDEVADLLVDMVGMMNTVIFQHWTSEQVIDVIGPHGIPLWVKFRPDMLRRGVYEIKVDPDNSIPRTRELRMQTALALYERLKTNPIIDPVQLTQYLLHELQGTQFDGMMRQLPGGAGLSPQNPLSVDQFAGVLGQNQQALPAPGG
jgi:hypothetical protein